MQPQAAPENSITIQWRPDLLGRLCEQLSRQPNPEEQLRECGGLLLGTVQRDGERVQIIVRLFTPFSCSYQEGPLYHLSSGDQSGLQRSIALYASPHWSCIGFYRSHCRPGLELDDQDLQLARHHLKNLPSIFLLLNTVAGNSPHGALFLFNGVEFSRDPAFFLSSAAPVGGTAEAPELPGNRSTGIGLPRASDAVAKGLAALAVQLHGAVELAQKRASAQLSGFRAGLAKRRIPGWLACTLILLVIGLFAVWNRGERHASESNGEMKNSAAFNSSLGLVTSVEVDHIRIAWNPHAPAITRASKGTLLVTDGPAHHTVSLDQGLLARGSLVYYPTSDVATLELRIGDVTESLVAAGLDRVLKAGQSLPERANKQELVPQRPKDFRKSTGATRGTTSNQVPRNAHRRLDQRRSSPSPGDPGSERTRSKNKAPSSIRAAPPAPDPLQPPDPGKAANPTPGNATPLLVTSEQVDFVAAQAIKHVSPLASVNALRSLVASVTIRVQVHINSQGRVVRAESLSHGSRLIAYLSRISVSAAREWLFAPARRAGRDVDSDTVLEFVFANKEIEPSP
jgi:hypothetical protein